MIVQVGKRVSVLVCVLVVAALVGGGFRGTSQAQASPFVTIFSNLASHYPKGEYWCCEGYNVMGPNSGAGEQLGSACSFVLVTTWGLV